MEDIKGRIFDIQRFSVHDGPGIRTIVFLKGCYLRCKWCCNPESQSYEFETMIKNGKETTVGREASVSEIMEIVLKDRPYYYRSGGGLTLSGGEFLFQPEFSKALLKSALQSGINTAVESTGFADFKIIKELLPYINLFLMDIKHINPNKHKEFTGRDNELILKNARLIAENAQKLIIRVPVIPTFNDTEDEIKEIAEFAASLPNVNEMHLLPYHNFGTDKYKNLNRKYLLSVISPPSSGHMEKLLNEAKKTGLKCQIGG